MKNWSNMNMKLMGKGWLKFPEEITLHAIDDTHMWLIIPKNYNPSEGWKERMRELVKNLFNLKLKIAYKK